MLFNPTRLKIARKRRKLTCAMLAKSLHITAHTVGRWESRPIRNLSLEKIRLLSQALEFPEAFFFGKDVLMPEMRRITFRYQTCTNVFMRDAAFAFASIGFITLDWITKYFSFPASNVPKLNEILHPEYAANALRKLWSLGTKPIGNIVDLLESHGVHVFYLPENTPSLSAYSFWHKDRPYIFLNRYKKTAERCRFDAAYELGRLVLYAHGVEDSNEAKEHATLFAAAFLMPESDVLIHCKAYMTVDQIIAQKARWCVSAAALAYRLRKLDLLTEWNYRERCTTLLYRFQKNEPNPMNAEKSHLWMTMLKTIKREKKDNCSIASLIGIPEKELTDLLFIDSEEI